MQVLSNYVFNGLFYFGDPDTKATENFCQTMDKFLIALMSAWMPEERRKLTFSLILNQRLKVSLRCDSKKNIWYQQYVQWLEGGFLKYRKDWEESITKAYPNLEPLEKEQMQISQTTLEDLTMTGI